MTYLTARSRFGSIAAAALLALTSTAYAEGEPVVKISGELVNCDTSIKSINIYVVDGTMLNLLQPLPLKAKDKTLTFSVNIKGLHEGLYFLGPQPQSIKLLYLGEKDEIQVSGSCADFRNALVGNSPANATLGRVLAQSDALQNQLQQYGRQLQATPDVSGQVQIKAQMSQIDTKRKQVLDSLSAASPFLGKVLALKTYQSYAVNGGQFPSEYEYFALKYFQFCNFADEAYNYAVPILHEAMKNYALTMGQIPFSTTAMRDQLLEGHIRQMDMKGAAFKTSVAAIALGLRESGEEESFLHFTDNYLALYKGTNVELDNMLLQTKSMYESRRMGAIAPEIEQAQPDGSNFKLSSLRGNVVLIDFWASWCRPCRQENPNVVAAYKKYHAKGFDILGVSLDQSKPAWEAAIKQDGLTWHHVSDLKGWQNDAGKTYGVRSVPHSVLLDKEGRIIAKNLRGEELERKLAEVLGEK